MKLIEIIKYLGIFMLGVLCYAGIYSIFHKENSNIKSEYIEQTDTIYIEKIRPELQIKTRLKIKYIDTNEIKTKPFAAELDTVINKDSIKFTYIYPANSLHLMIRSAKDSIPARILIFSNNKKDKWWEKPTYAISGIIIGALICRGLSK